MSEKPEHYTDIVFDGPPGPVAGRFIEVENHTGASVSLGDWVQRDDGLWALRFKERMSGNYCWTHSKPTVPGYYWRRVTAEGIYAAQGPEMVRFTADMNLELYELGAWGPPVAHVDELSPRFEWAGPLMEPKEPGPEHNRE